MPCLWFKGMSSSKTRPEQVWSPSAQVLVAVVLSFYDNRKWTIVFQVCWALQPAGVLQISPTFFLIFPAPLCSLSVGLNIYSVEGFLINMSSYACAFRVLHQVACVGKRALGYCIAKRMAALNALDLKDSAGMVHFRHSEYTFLDIFET